MRFPRQAPALLFGGKSGLLGGENLKVGFTNTGGGLTRFLKKDGTGMALNHILAVSYDVFGFIETKLVQQPPSITGYFCLYRQASETRSGGIAVYFKKKFQFITSIVSRSKDFCTLWIKLRGHPDCYLCFVYAPTDCKKRSLESQDFFDKLHVDFNFYSRKGSVICFGDFNTRLGKITGDRSVSGNFVKNRNFDNFMGFLNGIDGVILNSRFACGQYTNTHTKGKKGGRSIVDFAVVKKQDLFRVSCLLVHKLYFLGKSGSSMAHDSIIETNVVAPVNNSSCSPAEPRPVYGRITGVNETGFDTALKSVLPSFDNFHVLSATDKFELLIKAFSFAKKNVLQIDLNPSPSPSLPKSLRKIYACI